MGVNEINGRSSQTDDHQTSLLQQATISNTKNNDSSSKKLLQSNKTEVDSSANVVDISGTTPIEPSSEMVITLPPLPEKTKKRLDKLFKEIDVNKRGKVDIEDLTEALNKRGHKKSKLNAQVMTSSYIKL